MNINKDWLYAAAIRAVRTFAQTALGLFTVGQALGDVNWLYLLSVAATSAVYSILTSVVNLPEASPSGTLYLDTTGEQSCLLEANESMDTMSKKKKIIFQVNSNVKLGGNATNGDQK